MDGDRALPGGKREGSQGAEASEGAASLQWPERPVLGSAVKLMMGRSGSGQFLSQPETPVGLFVGWAAATRLVGGPGMGHAARDLPALPCCPRTLI